MLTREATQNSGTQLAPGCWSDIEIRELRYSIQRDRQIGQNRQSRIVFNLPAAD
jgi:hypothetical protein